MRHIARHTFVISYNKDKVKFLELHKELKLFKEVWPTAEIDGDKFGEVKITYNTFKVAEGAAVAFCHGISRHDWWEEI